MSLEFVRAFANPGALSQGRGTVVVSGGDAPSPAVLAWGAAGAVPEGAKQPDDLDPNEAIDFTVECCNDSFSQKARKTETVTIASEQDPDTTITFLRPTELDFLRNENECSNTSQQQIAIAPISGVLTAAGQPVYGITNSNPQQRCDSSFTYDYS